MKIKPMIFNADMVKALIEGRKTQTRRPAKNQSTYSDFTKTPFEQGDLIYVRETFRLLDSSDQCDCEYPCSHQQDGNPAYFADDCDSERTWKPSIHMPRWASRLTLKVTGVRAERVQDITEADACLEGTTSRSDQWRRDAFKDTWTSIYGESWKRNDWVWVIEFEVIHQNVDLYIQQRVAA